MSGDGEGVAKGDLEPARVVFIDESATKTNLTRWWGRSLRGERQVHHAPPGHWHTISPSLANSVSTVSTAGKRPCLKRTPSAPPRCVSRARTAPSAFQKTKKSFQ